MTDSLLTRPPTAKTAGERLREIVFDVHAADPTLPPSRVRQIAFQMANAGDEILVPSRSERRHRKAR